jgi:hypothetical protein
MFEINCIHNDRCLIIIIFVSVLLATIGISTNNAFAMGQAPSTCNNRYDSSIISMIITNGNQTYDPIANPDLTFQIDNDKSYLVSFIIHTQDQSFQGNSLKGSTWYNMNTAGYWMGFCVNNIGPNQDIPLTQTLEHSGSIAPETIQTVSWHILTPDNITYNVKWVNPSNDTVSSDPSTNSSNLKWNEPVNDKDSSVIRYNIERSADGHTAWIMIKKNTENILPAHSDTVLTITPAYTYRVLAIDSIEARIPTIR